MQLQSEVPANSERILQVFPYHTELGYLKNAALWFFA